MSKIFNLENGVKVQSRFSPTFTILLTVFVDILGYSFLFPLLPFLVIELGLDPFYLGVIVAAYALMGFIFGPILGRISDKIGRRPVIIISVFISSISFLLFTIANSFFLLLTSRIIGGIATEIGVAQAYIVDMTNKETRVKGLSRLSATMGLAVIMGPAIGGALGEIGFWAAGLAATILTVINLLFVLFLMPETYNKDKREKVKKELSTDKNYIERLIIAFKNPLLNSIFGIAFLINFSFSAIFVIFSLFGADVYGFTYAEIGLVITYWGIIGVITQVFFMQRLERRFKDEKLLATGCILSVIGFLGMTIIQNIIAFMFFITIVSFGIEVIDIITYSFISKRTDADQQGGMLGIANSLSSLARVPGPIIGGILYAINIFFPFYLSIIILLFASGLTIRIFINRNKMEYKKVKEESKIIEKEPVKPIFSSDHNTI